MINTVIFDIGNVLVDFCWGRAFLEYFKFGGETFGKVAAATVLNDDWNLNDKGDLSDEEMLERFISNDPSVEAEIRQLNEHVEELVKKRDYADSWVNDLREKGYKVYILSNYPKRAFELGLDNGNLSFVKAADGAMISYKEHLIKPDPEFFKRLFAKYDINPTEAVFIDDNQPNIDSAKELGLNTILFKSKEQVLSELKQVGIEI